MSTAPPPSSLPPTDGVLWRGEADGAKRPSADRPGEILRLLSRAWRNVGLYGPDHKVAQTTVTTLHQFLIEVLSHRLTLRLFIEEDTFFEEDRAMLEESLRLYSLLSAFTERRIRAVQFNAGVTPQELTHLIEVLNLRSGELERLGGAEAYLAGRAVKNIAVGSAILAGTVVGALPGTEAGPGQGGGKGAGPGEGGGGPAPRGKAAAVKVDPQDAYRAGLRLMDELSYEASVNSPLNLAKARMVVNYFLDLIGDEKAALLGIAALRKYDEDTYHHSTNVCILSLLLGAQLNLERPQLLLVGLAALLHDIGKVRVPRDIITKPAKLTSEEMEEVKRHTIHGAHLLRELPGPARLAMVVAFEHHARYDLAGYPRVTRKKMPHLITRIVWVADCFDAMTTARREYRAPKRIDEALKEILDGAGTAFDPLLAKLFCKYCGTYLTRPAPPEATPGTGDGKPGAGDGKPGAGEGKSGAGESAPRADAPIPDAPSSPAAPAAGGA